MTEKRFVAKKTITVQLPLDVWERFIRLCKTLKLTKTELFKKMIDKMEA